MVYRAGKRLLLLKNAAHVVQEPGHGIEQQGTTVEAASWWEVPWKEVVALCECEREEIVPRHVCICCGKIFNGDGFRCTKCEIIEKDKRLNQRARARKYYQDMMPRKRVT